MAQVVFYCRKVSGGDIMDENFEKCQKEVIKEFIRRHWKLIRIIMVMLLLFFRFSPKLDKITKPKDTPVAVTVELSGKEDGGYQGYSFYLDDKQPMMGLIEGGITYRTIPIEQEDYDSMMNVGYGKKRPAPSQPRNYELLIAQNLANLTSAVFYHQFTFFFNFRLIDIPVSQNADLVVQRTQ